MAGSDPYALHFKSINSPIQKKGKKEDHTALTLKVVRYPVKVVGIQNELERKQPRWLAMCQLFGIVLALRT